MRIAIITGASSGLGREYALRADREHAYSEIWVIARRTDRLEELADECETPVRPISLDLSKPQSTRILSKLLGGVEEPVFEVGLLVNAAGFGKFGTYRDITQDETDAMIDLNCRALADITQAVLPYMDRGARIMQIASCAAFQPLPGLNLYAATKAFVLSYTRALRFELRGRDIRATAVCPYWIKTEFVKVARHAERHDSEAPVASAEPQARGCLVHVGEQGELPRCHLLPDRLPHAHLQQDHPRTGNHVDLGGHPPHLVRPRMLPKCAPPFGRKHSNGLTAARRRVFVPSATATV